MENNLARTILAGTPNDLKEQVSEYAQSLVESQNRKLATVEVVDVVVILEGCTEVECIHTAGYKLVVQKNLFKAGDRLVLVHQGSIFPKWAEAVGKTKGGRHLRRNDYVVRPVKIKGIWSEAFPMHISILDAMEPDLITSLIPAGTEVGHILWLGFMKSVEGIDGSIEVPCLPDINALSEYENLTNTLIPPSYEKPQ